MMTKSLYLHIGFGKTGTSTLQRFFMLNLDKFSSLGVAYPEAGRNELDANHYISTAAQPGGGTGSVLSIDIDPTDESIRPRHPRIRYLLGSSTDPATVDAVGVAARDKSNVFVILGGDHRCEHVLEELRLYHPLIRPGGYLIVEDTNINDHPTYPEFGPGPWEAVDQFLAENKAFRPDRSCERFLLTMNPLGYLRRVS